MTALWDRAYRLGQRLGSALRRPWTLGGASAFVVLLVAAALLVAGVVVPALELGGVRTPRTERVTVEHLDQGWGKYDKKDAQSKIRWFHHAGQGTRIIPAAWFFALEQPAFTPFKVGRFADRSYLARFGFLYDEDRPPAGGDDLPIGFAREEGFYAPYAKPPVKEPTPVVGLTCAACHTGRLDVPLDDGTVKGVLIEGGSAMINLGLFQDALSRALYFNTLLSPRFDRFARAVLGPEGPGFQAAKDQLRKDLRAYVDTGLASRNYAKEHKLIPVEGGFARTDALGLIGNRVFGSTLMANQVVTDAPVNFPPLWDTAWFDWVQYNASIRPPLARNIGEALGVGAVVDLGPDEKTRYDSTVNVPNLIKMEDQLGGDQPFTGLRPPRWDAMLTAVYGSPERAPTRMRVNDALAADGARLYHDHCRGCHLSPRDELAAAWKRGDFTHFTAPKAGTNELRFLKLPLIDLDVIGTDPNQALNFHRRVAVTTQPGPARDPDLNPSETISAEDGLFRITLFLRARALKGMTDKDKRFKAGRWRWLPEAVDRGDRDAILKGEGKAGVIVANLGYKARPLDGIWATPPYFHNGSVPSLYQVLLPADCRAATFPLASRRFDPRHVGYEVGAYPGASVMDTSLPGNSNAGHEFRNLTLEEHEEARHRPWDGKAGREDRWASVLDAADARELAGWSATKRWEAECKATAESLSRRPIKGVLGPAFSDPQRWQIVEYLKTL